MQGVARSYLALWGNPAYFRHPGCLQGCYVPGLCARFQSTGININICLVV